MKRKLLLVLCGIVLAGVLLQTLLPVADVHLRPRANEAIAVKKLHTIVELQNQYAAAHRYNAFACELTLLKSGGVQESDNSLNFLTTGMQNGYSFALVGCSSEANRTNVHYQITAVPIERDKTGSRAFCTDEQGTIWVDDEGSARNCLTLRHALQ
jgi:hypothetical protein